MPLSLALIAVVTQQHLTPQSDPALLAYNRLVALVGTSWIGSIKGPEGPVEVKARFIWGPNKSSVKAVSTIGINPKDPVVSEAFFAYDKKRKKLAYLDIHGGPEAYAGNGWMQGEKLILEFQHVGHAEIEYRVAVSFPQKGEMYTEFWGKSGNDWNPIMSYTRKKVTVKK